MGKDEMTTVSGLLMNKVDITHKPRRYQADNLAKAKPQVSEEELEIEASASPRAIPKTLTLERVIKYYETNAEGEFAKLYKQTAQWLRDFQQKKTPADKEE